MTFYTEKRATADGQLLIGLKYKDRIRYGKKHTNEASFVNHEGTEMYTHNALIKKDFIRLYGARTTYNSHAPNKTRLWVREFKVGDIATYDSYNLIYTGEITKITDKCVTITTSKGHEYNERHHRLDIATFAFKNERFDAVEAAEHNQKESYYI